MKIKLLLLLIITLKTSRCSLVIDNADQKGVYLSDYCPNMKYCREGAHVMCMYYDPNHVFGPRCENPVTVNMTADLANRLLDLINMIRSKIANGNETGKAGVLFPRGYGIFRLKWDSELATFAQVLAQQCMIRHDMCRATKRFPNPSQLVSIIRFTFPNWEDRKIPNLPPGLTPAKVVYAATLSLKNWYMQKSAVTEEMLKIYPDWSASPNESTRRLYLDMIHGEATHMGCGLSGYTEYVYFKDSKNQGLCNRFQIVCNFSAGARKGTNVYNMESPIPGQGYTSRCGCPPGSEEDNDCLCNEVKITRSKPEPTCPVNEPSGNDCDPTLVLLPIFTMEDAPPEKLYEMAEEIKNPLKNYILQRIDNTSDIIERQGSFKYAGAQSSAEMFDFNHAKGGEAREDFLWQRARNPFSPQSPAPSYYNIFHREKQVAPAFRLGLDSPPHSQLPPPLLSQLPPPPRVPPPPPPAAIDEYTSAQKDHEEPRLTASAAVRLQDTRSRPLPELPPIRRPKTKSPTLRALPPAPPLPRSRALPPPPPPPPPPRIPPPPPPAIDEYTSAQKDHEEPRTAASAALRLQDTRSRPLPKLPPKRLPKTKKASLFTRVAQFQLPNRRSMPAPLKVIKKDVAPRKDFSNLSKVVHDYLKSRPGYKIFIDNHEQNKPKEESKPHTEEKSQTDAVVTDTGLNNAEETVINFNQYLGQKNNSNYNEKDVDIKDDNDNKLLSLLDTLEREVKHIALDGSEKELFDAKIRKIYGSIVGKAALIKFPKPILISTADTEAPEIDFGESKVSDRLEPDHEEDNHVKVIEEPKQRSRLKIDQKIKRVKNYNPSIQGHKWKNKFIDSFDHKKYKDNMDVFRYGDRKPPSGGSYDHKYNGNFDHEYGDIDNKHMNDLDRKYNENIDEKYSENHLDHEYKFSDNFHHQHNNDVDRKYDDNEPASRSKIKYESDGAILREFGRNSLDTQEDTTPENYRYKDIKANHGTRDVPLISKDREKRKRNERKHRKRVKSLNAHNDPLSLERRKYYQERLDNIRKKLRSRRNRNNNDSRNERLLRRMHTNNQESSRSRSKSPADNFYMPERARFLHGF